jgi:hypothetical protein
MTTCYGTRTEANESIYTFGKILANWWYLSNPSPLWAASLLLEHL